MSFETYKLIHIAVLVLTVGCMGLTFCTTLNSKSLKISSGVFSLLLLISGFGLLAKLGFHSIGEWPMWVKVKILIWLVVASAAPMLAKRLTKHRVMAFAGLLGLLLAAVYIATYKPF